MPPGKPSPTPAPLLLTQSEQPVSKTLRHVTYTVHRAILSTDTINCAEKLNATTYTEDYVFKMGTGAQHSVGNEEALCHDLYSKKTLVTE